MKIGNIKELKTLASFLNGVVYKMQDGEKVGKPPFVLDVKKRLNLPIETLLRGLNYRPKKNVAEHSLWKLAESIRALGVLHRILIQKDKNGKMCLLDGKRRIRAAMMVGIKEIPVIFLKSQYQLTPLMVNLIKNNYKTRISPIDEAEFVDQLAEKTLCNVWIFDLLFGKNSDEVIEILKLRLLPDFIKEEYRRHFKNIDISSRLLLWIEKMEGTDDDKIREFMKLKDIADMTTKAIYKNVLAGLSESERAKFMEDIIT